MAREGLETKERRDQYLIGVGMNFWSPHVGNRTFDISSRLADFLDLGHRYVPIFRQQGEVVPDGVMDLYALAQ